jgi:hypothetical protein
MKGDVASFVEECHLDFRFANIVIRIFVGTDRFDKKNSQIT